VPFDPIPLLLGLIVPPLLIGFAAQLLFSAAQRHRVRRWTAAVWTAFLSVMSSVADGGGSTIGLFLFTLLVVTIAFLAAWLGAFIGSAAALRIKRLAGKAAAGRPRA
jgi:hypothetical protein